MTGKYDLAKQAIATIESSSSEQAVDAADAQEATLVLLVQELKESRGVAYLRNMLQFELDNLGRGGVYDVAKGGGHS